MNFIKQFLDVDIFSSSKDVLTVFSKDVLSVF
jgi:hypothetical protein